MPLQFDTGKQNLEMFFKPWQVEAIDYLWSIHPEGANSKTVWENVNQRLNGTISRASIINYLNDMVDEDLLTYTDTTGKGGHHRIYTIKYTPTDFKKHIAQRIIHKLLQEYPEATRKTMKKLQ